jgi:hypothetical protein
LCIYREVLEVAAVRLAANLISKSNWTVWKHCSWIAIKMIWKKILMTPEVSFTYNWQVSVVIPLS